MNSLLQRFFPSQPEIKPLVPGVYHAMVAEEGVDPYRLHLRIEADDRAVLIVNAATVLHLNPTAVVHALAIVQGKTAEEAAAMVTERYRVSKKQALEDHLALREQILTIATQPDIDPVMFFNLEREDPLSIPPAAPYRVDLALTYRLDGAGSIDPLAGKRVDRELDTEEWKAVLSKLWDVGVPHVTFTGGEPTLLDTLPDLIQHAEDLGMVTGVLTDGHRFINDGYLKQLEAAGLDHILLTWSDDAPDFNARLQHALDTDVFTAVHITLTPHNIDAAWSFLASCAELGVPAVSLSISEHSDLLKDALLSMRERAAETGLELIWDLPAPYSTSNPISLELEEQPQGAGRAWLYIEPDGDVLPAQGINQVLGNLLRDGWEAVWKKANAFGHA